MAPQAPPLPISPLPARKLRTMRAIQDAALDLIEAEGFVHATVEQIAATAGVGPATVYRHFATKEQLVLWDEYDPPLLEALERRLSAADPFGSFARIVIDVLETFYEHDRERILRRSRLAFSEPSLQAAGAANQAAFREVLAGVLYRRDSRGGWLKAQVFAGAAVATLVAAIEEWVREEGRVPLHRVFARSFSALRRMGRARARTSSER